MKLVLRNQNRITLSTTALAGVKKNKITFAVIFKSISCFGKELSTRKTHTWVFYTTIFTQLSMADT